jgi:hypothetical protein
VAQADKLIEGIPKAPILDVKQKQALDSLTRREQEIRKAQQALKIAQEQWRNESGQFVSKKELETNTLKTLQSLGITQEKLVELQLSNPNYSTIAPQDAVQAELSALRAELNTFKTNTETQRTTQEQNARAQAEAVILQDAKLLVANSDHYPAIKALNKADEIKTLIAMQFDASGELLSIEEAARLVEAELIERHVTQRKQLDALEAVQALLAPVVPQGEAGKSVVPPAAKPMLSEALQAALPTTQAAGRAATLTNRQTVARPLSVRERAIQAFEQARTKQG